MIRELSDLGKRLREVSSEGKIIHNALKDEPVSIDLIILSDGSFVRFDVIEKIYRPAEAITAKKGKARLLLDKAEEVLGYAGNSKKHGLFMGKLEEYKELKELEPVFLFYGSNKKNGIEKALLTFENQVGEKERNGNIAFRLEGEDIRLHENKRVIDAIITKFDRSQKDVLKNTTILCSICGKPDYPILDMPHGMIKRVPDGQSSGCALVSYNEKAFESYQLAGNMNSSICVNCARTYVEGLNWLLANGNPIEDGKKKYFKYTNRINFGSDTAMVFWTRENKNPKEISLLEEPNPGEIVELVNTIRSGEKKRVNPDSDIFYSCTLSGVAARIAIRDWILQGLEDLKESIALWFQDIAITIFDFDTQKEQPYFPGLYDLMHAPQNEKDKNDVTSSRVGTLLWKAAIRRESLPIWILNAVLKRIRVDMRGVTPERVSLIRLIINRHKGGQIMKESLDERNLSVAYNCGRIFSVLEGIQRAALGKNLNAGIRERFFSSASMNPSSAFGRLMKMSQNHLSKIKGEKPGLAVILDKELQQLFEKVSSFPVIFTLEEQGQFAIGYYHQKQETFKKASETKELKDILEDKEEINQKGEES